MKIQEYQKRQFFAWARRSGYDPYQKRTAGRPTPQTAYDHMKHKPYGRIGMTAEDET